MSDSEKFKYKLYRKRTSDPWGFKITTLNNQTYITGVFEDTPASKAGVEINEIIVSINRVPCWDVSHDHIFHVIRKVDHSMVLVTRKPRSDEEQHADRLSEKMPTKGMKIVEDLGDFHIQGEPSEEPKYHKRTLNP
uniref:PDZ domain-containing protein n=1 Tax=Mesocestoides corti TaxID=53468 RepID=A0A5K3EZN9_MESCO